MTRDCHVGIDWPHSHRAKTSIICHLNLTHSQENYKFGVKMNMHQCDIFYINMPEFLWGPPWPPPTPERSGQLTCEEWGVRRTWDGNCAPTPIPDRSPSRSPGRICPIHVIYIRCNQLRFLQLWLDWYTRDATLDGTCCSNFVSKIAEDATICESAAKLRWVQSTVRPWEGPRSVCILFTFHSLS